MVAVRTSNTHALAVDAAIELFSRQGYEQTTVEEIADAAQVSRATFFRRYRSKEDVVFADHELLLEQVVVMLAATRPDALDEGDVTERSWDPTVDPYLEVCRAARLVFDHHLGQRDTSLARYRLLQQVPTLRDRELVTTHRYERLFTKYLRDTLPADRSSTVQSIAFAAAVVAVHNTFLRRWLRSPDLDLRPELEEAFAELRRGATADLARRRDLAAGTATLTTTASRADGGRVVVAYLEPGATPQAIARAVEDALTRPSA
ncbi:MAG: TetR/AcrR family transcriptional regulator [Promicromonosporaceae bacterium]|nr:TetR/AcrR family transcriptional regulator [Promicromonosporaceae bacterium]